MLCFTDGKTIVPMLPSCDHKRAQDGDRGLNTGGMGTFTPCPFYTQEIADEVREKILLPTVAAMNAEGRPFKGVLYCGLMRTPEGMKVVEYNARFGDPETQVVLPMLKTDLLTIFEAVTDGRLADVNIEWRTARASASCSRAAAIRSITKRGNRSRSATSAMPFCTMRGQSAKTACKDERRQGSQRLRQREDGRRGAQKGIRCGGEYRV